MTAGSGSSLGPDEILSIISDVESRIRASRGASFELNLYQRGALRILLTEIAKDGRVSGVLQMPTGTGKTLLVGSLLVAMASSEKLRTLLLESRDDPAPCIVAMYLAPLRVIRDQVKEEFHLRLRGLCGLYRIFNFKSGEALRSHLHGLPRGWRIARALGGARDVVYVVTPQLLQAIRRRMGRDAIREIASGITALFMDEVHIHYPGPDASEVIELLIEEGMAKGLRVVLGLTATPISESFEVAHGGLLFHKSSRDAMARGLLTPRVRVVRYRTEIRDIRPLERSPSALSSLISTRDPWKYAIPQRARWYAERISHELSSLREELRRRGIDRLPKALVLAASTTEADMLRRQLEELASSGALPPGYEVIAAHTRITEGDPSESIKWFKDMSEAAILVAVDMVKVGFDDRNLEALFFARPIRSPVSYVQLRGRVLRRPSEDQEGWNAKSVLGYATIVDLTGESFLEVGREQEVEKVERGEYGRGGLPRILQDLQGECEVEKAEARVNVERVGEWLIPSKAGVEAAVDETHRPGDLEWLLSILHEVNLIEPRVAATRIENLGAKERATFPLGKGVRLELSCEEESGRRVVYASIIENGARGGRKFLGTPREVAGALRQLASSRRLEALQVERIVRDVLSGKVLILKTEIGDLELRLTTRGSVKYISVRVRKVRTPSLKVRVRGTLKATARALANALSNNLPPQARPKPFIG